MSDIEDGIKYLRDRGGPMFPIVEMPMGEAKYSASGLTARDYFAGQALVGICSNDHSLNNYVPQQCSEWAYQFADAMLAERGDKPPARFADLFSELLDALKGVVAISDRDHAAWHRAHAIIDKVEQSE